MPTAYSQERKTMLTKDLVLYTTSGDRVVPKFINPQKESLLDFAGQMLNIFKSAEGKTRAELLEESKLVVDGAPCSAFVARGIQKRLFDRTEFDTAPNEELIQFRRELFTQTSRLLSEFEFSDFNEYKEKVNRTFLKSPEGISETLYADLPEYQQVTAFKSLSPERLLHRYNCAQVQGLLIRCNELELTLADSKAASLRQLFKYLRFHQLLATIRKGENSNFRITVDGPLNLFYKTQKYGLSLANFFPAVLHQESWQLQANIQINKRHSYHLQLDESSGLQPYSHQFLAYVPQEIEFFQENFCSKAEGWQIAPANSFIPLEGEIYCFPDFTLTHESGKEISLELFHPWHASHLATRLQQLENQTEPVLIIGAAKELLKDALIRQTVETSEYFSRFGFVFREMPTVERVKKVLMPVVDKQ